MNDPGWLATPIGIDAKRWVSRSGCRTILVAVHTMAAGHRLLDLVDLVEDDDRVQTVFTVAPDAFNSPVAGHLHRLGALVIPWQQAIRERFDLALAAAHGGLHELHAPVMLTAHGAGRARLFQPVGPGGRAAGEPTVYGLDAARLTRDGRVVAARLLLSHDGERTILARQCPEALPHAVVVGDPCFDGLVASIPERWRYRQELGIGSRQSLVVVTSTWGGQGLFGAHPGLLPSLMEQLPAGRFRTALLLHPAIWAAHGHRQILAWTRACRAAGMILVDPAEDWRAYVAAADQLIGDCGSVTAYGAATGLPVLYVPAGETDRTAAGSPHSLVLEEARRLDPTRPVLPQLLAAHQIDHQKVAAALTSRPGRSGPLIKQVMYGLMGLSERETGREASPEAVSGPSPARAAS